ncbi:hypothetical protein AtEden1_Chr2g0229121 [Arabidopsis thaliana]
MSTKVNGVGEKYERGSGGGEYGGGGSVYRSGDAKYAGGGGVTDMVVVGVVREKTMVETNNNACDNR